MANTCNACYGCCDWISSEVNRAIVGTNQPVAFEHVMCACGHNVQTCATCAKWVKVESWESLTDKCGTCNGVDHSTIIERSTAQTRSFNERYPPKTNGMYGEVWPNGRMKLLECYKDGKQHGMYNLWKEKILKLKKSMRQRLLEI